jgi:hypothetical protein
MIRFPAGQRFSESRTAVRYPIAAPAELLEPVNERHVQGWTTVIGEAGCYVRAADTLPAGAVAQLRIEREGGSFESARGPRSASNGHGAGILRYGTAATGNSKGLD